MIVRGKRRQLGSESVHRRLARRNDDRGHRSRSHADSRHDAGPVFVPCSRTTRCSTHGRVAALLRTAISASTSVLPEARFLRCRVWTLKRHCAQERHLDVCRPTSCGSLALLCSGLKQSGSDLDSASDSVVPSSTPPAPCRAWIGSVSAQGSSTFRRHGPGSQEHGDRHRCRCPVRGPYAPGDYAGRGVSTCGSRGTPIRIATVAVTSISPDLSAGRRPSASGRVRDSTPIRVDRRLDRGPRRSMMLVHGGNRFDCPGRSDRSRAGRSFRGSPDLPTHRGHGRRSDRAGSGDGAEPRVHLDREQRLDDAASGSCTRPATSEGGIWICRMERPGSMSRLVSVSDESVKRTLVVHATQLEEGRVRTPIPTSATVRAFRGR